MSRAPVTDEPRRRRAREAIAGISRAGLPADELLRRVSGRLRAVVPYHLAGWLTTDPATILYTGTHAEGVSVEGHVPFVENERWCPTGQVRGHSIGPGGPRRC